MEPILVSDTSHRAAFDQEAASMTWYGLVADVTAHYPPRESKMFGIPCLWKRFVEQAI